MGLVGHSSAPAPRSSGRRARGILREIARNIADGNKPNMSQALTGFVTERGYEEFSSHRSHACIPANTARC